MFKEMLPAIGTKNFSYDVFNNRMMGCSSGLRVELDRFTATEDYLNVKERNEQLLVSTGFLDRNTEKAFDCLKEIIVTPNFAEHSHIKDLIKMGSVNKSNNIGNKGLEYATSYGTSGLRAHARSFESLRSDMFFCQYAAKVKEQEEAAMLDDAISKMTEIASHVFQEGNIEFSVHSDAKKFDKIQLQLDQLLSSI